MEPILNIDEGLLEPLWDLEADGLGRGREQAEEEQAEQG